MKNPTIYRRAGWKDVTIEGTKPKDGQVDLINEAGKVVVTALPFIADPSKLPANELPTSFATREKAATPSGPPEADEEKVAQVVGKIDAGDEAEPFTLADLNRVNVPTLNRITEELQLQGLDPSAKADDLKQAIVEAAAPAAPEEDGAEADTPAAE